MRDASRIISGVGVLLTFLYASACTADATPSMGVVLQTFVENRSEFNASVAAITSLELDDDRVTLRDSDSGIEHPDIAGMFKLRPVSVKTIIVYPNYGEGLLIDYLIDASGLSVGGKSLSVVYDASGSRAADDPAMKQFPSCDGIDLRDVVENNSVVLISKCRIAELWILKYTAN